jgi:hypothetical protein
VPAQDPEQRNSASNNERMKVIILTVTTTAEIEVKGSGFKGKECTKHINVISDALGRVKERKNTPEYHTYVQKKQTT